MKKEEKENKSIKPTVLNMARYYGVSAGTIQNWKSTRPLIFRAVKNDFVAFNNVEERYK